MGQGQRWCLLTCIKLYIVAKVWIPSLCCVSCGSFQLDPLWALSKVNIIHGAVTCRVTIVHVMSRRCHRSGYKWFTVGQFSFHIEMIKFLRGLSLISRCWQDKPHEASLYLYTACVFACTLAMIADWAILEHEVIWISCGPLCLVCSSLNLEPALTSQIINPWPW